MCAVKTRERIQKARHNRVRRKVIGTSARPRLAVYRSTRNIYAQIIDDSVGRTLIAASTLEKDFKDKTESGCNKGAARIVGELIAAKAKAKGIETVVFDRGGFRYHGRVKELAEAARAAGLLF